MHTLWSLTFVVLHFTYTAMPCRDDCKEFNPQRLQPGFMDAGEDEGYLEDEYIWPRTARHEPNDFRKYYTVVDSSVLAYTFSSRAAQVVPDVEL